MKSARQMKRVSFTMKRRPNDDNGAMKSRAVVVWLPRLLVGRQTEMENRQQHRFEFFDAENFSQITYNVWEQMIHMSDRGFARSSAVTETTATVNALLSYKYTRETSTSTSTMQGTLCFHTTLYYIYKKIQCAQPNDTYFSRIQKSKRTTLHAPHIICNYLPLIRSLNVMACNDIRILVCWNTGCGMCSTERTTERAHIIYVYIYLYASVRW